MNSKFRPLYSQLQGLLSQTPPVKNLYDSLEDNTMWEQFNLVLDTLKTLREDEEYDSFRITPKHGDFGQYVKLTEYRSKLGALISRMHGDYFYHEVAPFSGTPSTVITQNQSQEQTAQAQVVMLLDIQNLINDRLANAEDENEKGFLEDVKSKLVNVKNVAELIQLLILTASTYKITIEQLIKIFT